MSALLSGKLSLAKIFNLNELYPKKPQYWIDVVGRFDKHDDITLKESTLKYLLNQKIFMGTSFSTLRNSFHKLIEHYFNSENNEKGREFS